VRPFTPGVAHADKPETTEELVAIADERLSPRLTNPNYLVLRSRRVILENWLSQLPGPLTVLDIGARYQPYRSLLKVRTGRYLALDILKTDLVDVVANAESLPFAMGIFDLVIATQVFEYFTQPQNAANQIHAILKTGGTLLMSVPAMAPIFGVEQQWRFTPAGIRTTLASFSEIEIVPETSSLGGFIRTANLALYTFMHYPILKKLFSVTACPFLNLFGLVAGWFRLGGNDQFIANYSVRARKGTAT
jgi:SAM-dependent methyltransferase